MSLYPTPPGLRVPYDRDGSVGFVIDRNGTVWTMPYSGNFPTEFGTSFNTGDATETNDDTINSQASIGSSKNPVYVGVLFSMLWDIKGYYLSVSSGSGMAEGIDVSTDSTNGIDGTWTRILTGDSGGPTLWDWTNTAPSYPAYRSNVQTLGSPSTGLKGIRFYMAQGGFLAGSVGVLSMHLYGTPSAGQTLHMIAPWHPTLDQWADGGTADFGDIGQGTAATHSFRAKNLSPSFTAHSVLISDEALTDATPTLIGQYQFSTDNVNFFNAVNIGDLAPGATSALIYYRDSVLPDAALSVWSVRAVGTPASWS